MPPAVKELAETAGVRTAAARAVLEHNVPSEDAEVCGGCARPARSCWANSIFTNSVTAAAECSATSAPPRIPGEKGQRGTAEFLDALLIATYLCLGKRRNSPSGCTSRPL